MAVMSPRQLRDFRTYPLLRSYAREDAAGNFYRVEVRRDPATGCTLQASFPL